MKASKQLAKRLQEHSLPKEVCEDPVLRYGKPYLVPLIYKEHVDGWYCKTHWTQDEENAWLVCRDWLRQLERGLPHRLFSTELRLNNAWWDVQVKAIVSRKSSSRRMSLPLEDEIDIFLEALQPHLVVWITELVHERNMDLQMFPKHLLHRTYVGLRHLTDVQFHYIVQKCYDIYPQLPHNAVTREDVLQAHFPVHLSHWPGLRVCPPFFFDLAVLQPPPSRTFPRGGKFVVIHSHLDMCYAKTRQQDAQTCRMEEICVSLEPFAHSVGVSVTDETRELITQTLKRLDGIHPRSFKPDSTRSPYAMAAMALTPHVKCSGEGVLNLPEHAIDGCEIAFSSTFMKPRIVDGHPCTWDKEEEFYQVNLPLPIDEVVRLSSYTGFGLRLRHTLLSVATNVDELKGQGVAIIVPDGLTFEATENVMLTAIGWLQGLGLVDVKLLSESVCHAMCLGSMSVISQKESPSAWASLHDGALVSQWIGVNVTPSESRIQDQWKDRYRGLPLKLRVVEKLRDYLFDQPPVQDALGSLVNNRFLARTLIIENIKRQLPRVLHLIEATFATEAVMSSFPLDFPNLPSATVTLPKDIYLSWLHACFDEWTAKSWWLELKDHLEDCKGVVVSGGIFESCPSALEVLVSKLGANAKVNVKKNRLTMLHGACLAIYTEKRCQTLLLLDENDRLPMLKLE